MRTNNTSPFVFNWFNAVAVAIAIVITAAIGTAKGQDYYDAINGLFTPTQAENFFQTGREDFEREIEIFNHPERYFKDDFLQIDPKLIEQMDRSRQQHNFKQNSFQHELYIDTIND